MREEVENEVTSKDFLDLDIEDLGGEEEPPDTLRDELLTLDLARRMGGNNGSKLESE